MATLRNIVGLLLMIATLAGQVLMTTLGTGLTGIPTLNGPIFFVFWGFFGPVFFLGLYLVSGGPNLSAVAHFIFLVLGAASILLAVLANEGL